MIGLGIWVLCGCAISFLIFIIDEDKGAREEIYSSNLYIVFMIIFWPIAIYFFLRFLVAAIISKKSGED